MSDEASCRVRVNPERTGAVWWDEARLSRRPPAAILPLLEVLGPEEIAVTSTEAAAIRLWGAALPGWEDGGPPLLIEPAEDQGKSEALSVPLPERRRESDTSIEAALRSRRSVREFTPGPLTLAEVSQLLWAAQGETGAGGLRTAPSAGALYPLQLYLVSGDVAGLDPAVYRYDPRRHELHRARDHDRRAELSAAALHQECVGSAAAILVIAADGRPTTAKYGTRARRYIEIEAGHAAQNVHLQAVALGLGSVDVGAFDDAAVKRVLGLPAAEDPLLLLPLGRKRKDKRE